MMKKEIKFTVKSVEDLKAQMRVWADENLPIEYIEDTKLASKMLKDIGIKVT